MPIRIEHKMFEITIFDKNKNKHVFIIRFPLHFAPLNPGLQWQYKRTVNTGSVYACNWVSNQHLAVCMEGCVKVYEVTTHDSQLVYQMSSDEWKGKLTIGVAVSDALLGSMLVICEDRPYVYQFPCHEATQEVKKYKIQGDRVAPYCIVANANTAAIDIDVNNTIVICSLPDFTHQYHVQAHFNPYDLSISTDKLLVMGEHGMAVKPLDDVNQDLCKMNPPGGWKFRSVCFRNINDATEIYAVCNQDGKRCVYRYIWDADKSQYVNTEYVIGGVGWVGYGCLSVTSDGLLALCGGSNVKVYSFLE